jgi:hypothetical protein
MPIHRHDVDVRRVVVAGALVAATVAAVVAAIVFALQRAAVPLDGARDARPDVPTAGLSLESAPQLDLQRERAAQRTRLQSAGWVDESAGIAHIPIDDAITLLGERGLRAVPADAAASR